METRGGEASLGTKTCRASVPPSTQWLVLEPGWPASAIFHQARITRLLAAPPPPSVPGSKPHLEEHALGQGDSVAEAVPEGIDNWANPALLGAHPYSLQSPNLKVLSTT